MKTFIIFVMFVSSILDKKLVKAAIEEFCHSELFQPKCETSDIIVIQEAYFGRRTMGKCLLEEGKPSESYLNDPQFIGCYADVKDVMEAACSGRNSCDMIISKIKTTKTTNCHNWLKLHLEISYMCLKITPENRHCTIQVTNERIHISNSLSSSSLCGSKNNPWKVETLNGQKLNISLLHIIGNIANNVYFDIGSMYESRYECQEKGSILDKYNNRKSTKICSMESEFKKDGLDYLVTDSNAVEIILDKMNIKNGSGFVIGLEATGCSDLIPPADAWLKRTENEATIGCYSTRLRWQLKCIGQRWIGVIGNCSQGHTMNSINTPVIESVTPFKDQTVPIVAIAMAGFVICFFIVCIGVVFLNRYYAFSKANAMKLNNGNHRMLIQSSVYNEGSTEKYPQFQNETWKSQNGNLVNLKDGGDYSLQNPAHYFELDQTLINNKSSFEK